MADSSRLSKTIVVIPTLNEEDHIEDCIRSLVDGEPPTQRPIIVVADGGSTDRTRSIVEDLSRSLNNLRLIANPDRLQAAAVNLAVEATAQSGHLYLVRCDAHAAYPLGYVRAVVDTLVERDVASVATVMDAKGRGCFGRAVAAIVDTRLGSGGSGHRGGTTSGFVDHGHHAGMRLDWFHRVGGYNPTFDVNEDAEYDHRLRRAGGRIWLAASIRITYFVRPTPWTLMRQYFRYGRGRARMLLLHRARPRLRQVLPVVNLLLITSSLGLTLLHPLFLAWPVLYVTILVGVSVWGVGSLRSVCGLFAGFALAVMHLSWGAGFIWRLANRG